MIIKIGNEEEEGKKDRGGMADHDQEQPAQSWWVWWQNSVVEKVLLSQGENQNMWPELFLITIKFYSIEALFLIPASTKKTSISTIEGCVSDSYFISHNFCHFYNLTDLNYKQVFTLDLHESGLERFSAFTSKIAFWSCSINFLNSLLWYNNF